MILKSSRLLLLLLRRFYQKKSGVVTVEMTLLIIPFILLFLFVAELCTVLYISVSIDLAMAEAMRYTSSSNSASLSMYKTTFTQRMEERIKQLPLMIFHHDNVQFTTKYCTSRTEIANNTCTIEGGAISAEQYPVAFFTIKYKHNPIFFPIPNAIVKDGVTRMGIYVMENLRIRKQADEN